MNSDLKIDLLSEADISAALRLTAQSGWNQTVADWGRLLDLWPRFCLGGHVAGQLVATATLAVYEGQSIDTSVGWVGMVLVDEAHRRRGFGAAMLDAALEAGRGVGVGSFGLDATDLGRAVYVGRGFADAAAIERWVRPPGSAAGATGISPTTCEASVDQLTQILELDARATGVDRRALLAHLAGESGVTLRFAVGGGHVQGFAMRRPGRVADQIGPVVAESEPLAAALVADLLAGAAQADARPVLIDVPRGRMTQSLPAAGFEVARRLVRMRAPPPRAGAGPPLGGPGVFAACGFEVG